MPNRFGKAHGRSFIDFMTLDSGVIPENPPVRRLSAEWEQKPGFAG
jgi:hypothetical protein